MNRTVYRHPDGPTLEYVYGELTAVDADGNKVALPIGPAGLADLAKELASLANDSDNLAEQLGAATALDCMNVLLAAKHESQGDRIRIVQHAILQLIATANPARAAAGFAVVIENVIVRGLEVLI
jgi:hypothetical protein